MKKSRNATATFLAVVPGLVGLFGLGHVYLGQLRRAGGFLLVTSLLYGLLAVVLLVPTISIPVFVLPGIWFLGWAAQIYDIRRPPRTPHQAAMRGMRWS